MFDPKRIQPVPLTDEEKKTWEWQMWTPGVGLEGQERLKGATVMVSRCGGLGSVVAYELAAAGVGKLVLAHAGNTKHSDLNRQLLMTYDNLGKSRIQSVKRRLHELNPHVEIIAIDQNVNKENAAELVGMSDIVVDCAPLFQERLAMNDQAMKQGKAIVECAMYDTEFQITTMHPDSTPCLRCLHPDVPEEWKREFPVFGACSGTVACMGAMEVIKMVTGIGEPLYGQLLRMDMRSMEIMKLKIKRRSNFTELFSSTD